ncbi:hypothetical protein KEJ15_09260 [Candidatus Bathyarchaeota archaeon]|nr:hypothetical protein [Candidatus Bathyarchaeota archaeon]
MAEQIKQESSETSAQPLKKTRSSAEKIGRLKYNQYLLKRVLTEISEVRDVQRIILNGLKGAGYFQFDIPLIQKFACEDQLDLDILEMVYESGRGGIYPKDVAAALPQYKDTKGQPIKHFHVSRRIQRMNKRLEYEIGERLFEKRGWKWAVTKFAFDVWAAVDKKEIEETRTLADEEM